MASQLKNATDSYSIEARPDWVTINSDLKSLQVEIEQLRTYLFLQELHEVITQQITRERDKLAELLDQTQREIMQLKQEAEVLQTKLGDLELDPHPNKSLCVDNLFDRGNPVEDSRKIL